MSDENKLTPEQAKDIASHRIEEKVIQTAEYLGHGGMQANLHRQVIYWKRRADGAEARNLELQRQSEEWRLRAVHSERSLHDMLEQQPMKNTK